MHVANSTKCNCIFAIRIPYVYVIPEGNIRLHLGSPQQEQNKEQQQQQQDE